MEKIIPKLGFGLMRLPMIDKQVDIKQTMEMADAFIKEGFCYFDTAHGYIEGLSEAAVKPVLSERYPREDFVLADKMSHWCVENGDTEGFFQSQLEITGAGYFDYYLLHSLTPDSLPKYDELDAWSFCIKKKEQGLIKHFGFSFHGNAAMLEEVLSAHPEVEFVQLQLNYRDWESDGVQSRLCYETARKHGKGVIVMEPVKGGSLAVLPEESRKILAAANPKASVASFALRFAASLDGVITVLSGMSNTEQAFDNINTMRDFEPLNETELDAIEAVVEILEAAPTVGCTNCKYCTEKCPMEISIPTFIRRYNHFVTYDNQELSKNIFGFELKNAMKASDCIECGACEEICPQHLPIRELLKKVSSELE